MFSSRQSYQINPSFSHRNRWQWLHIDPILLLILSMLIGFGFVILYSATNQNPHFLMRQLYRLTMAFGGMLFLAQIPPAKIKQWTPALFAATVSMLVAVLLMGKIGKGAQRWLDFGFFRFQPSEIAKFTTPMIVAWYLCEKQLPPQKRYIFIATMLIFIPTLLIAKQPDLGTAIIVLCSGASVLLFAGISWRFIASVILAGIGTIPFLWHHLHQYQKDRVLTFLNPERDPLGSGYHIIQSKIAIGSGGLIGKGWLNGTQSHLHFLPEHATDFIFAVAGEEFGFVGCFALIVLYLGVVLRSLFIASQAQESFTRLLACSIGFTFFISAAVNIGMVTGIVPVVGLPLPLVSYGGTSLVSLLAGFGILMSIHTHKSLLKGVK